MGTMSAEQWEWVVGLIQDAYERGFTSGFEYGSGIKNPNLVWPKLDEEKK